MSRSASSALRSSYDDGITDEFVVPTVIGDEEGEPTGAVREGDVAIFFNFRADRARQLTRALSGRFERFVCMTQYDAGFDLPVAFPPLRPERTFAEVISRQGLRQFRAAETEKYAHVTYFFGGGREDAYPGEERILIPSARDVSTYDQKPEMSAPEVSDAVVQRIEQDGDDFALVNFANPDMVGHTGDLGATRKAVRVVDACLGKLHAACTRKGWVLAVTGDHGNCEQMIDPQTGRPQTSHNSNPVPLYLIHPVLQGRRLRAGTLADVAPTLLCLMGIPAPAEMTGTDLLSQSD
jgi:2,3-bisphosphoglycerate-independent phosphoglycerate mutase